MAKVLEKMFRESLVIEIAWQDKIDYEIDEKLNYPKFGRISFINIVRKYLSKRIRSIFK